MFQTDFSKQKKHVTANGKYLISTNNTWDHGWETMVFRYNKAENKVTDWIEIDVDRYNDQNEAYAGHEQMISKWESKLTGE